MAFRIEKRTFTLITSLVLLTPAFTQREFRYDVWHGHSRPPHIRKAGGKGALIISDTGISFTETYKDGKTPKHPHVWRWDYQDIQQLKVVPKSLTVLTYKDNGWKLGADREYEFDLVSEMTFADAYSALKGRLDQRFVAAMEDAPTNMLWEIPVKHLRSFGGDEGVLQAGPDEILQVGEGRAVADLALSGH